MFFAIIRERATTMKMSTFFGYFFVSLTLLAQPQTSYGITPGCALSKVGREGKSLQPQKPHDTFTGMQAMRAKIQPAINKAYDRLQEEFSSGKLMHSKQTEEARFLELLEEENGGLFHFFDTPEGFKLKDGSNLPKKFADLLVTDHHDGFGASYFDPQTPKKNTTMQLLDFIENELNLSGGNTKVALENLKRRIGSPATDNLADGMESVYIVNHLERFLEDPSLRDKMRVAQYFVDFGVFGGKSFELDPATTLAKVFPNKKFTEEDIRVGIQIGKAILQNYNEIILNPQNEIKMGDRFHETTFGTAKADDKQKAIAEQALSGLDTILNPSKVTERIALEKKFKEMREIATSAVQKQATNLRQDMAKILNSEKQQDLIQNYDTSGGKLGKLLYAHYGINPAETGLFAAWSGPGNAHTLPFDLTINPKIGPNKDRTGFILSNVDGREMPEINLKLFGSKIYALNVIAVRKRLSSTGLTGAELEAEVAKQTSTAIGGREPLQYSFGGVELPPEVIIEEAYNFLKSF